MKFNNLKLNKYKKINKILKKKLMNNKILKNKIY